MASLKRYHPLFLRILARYEPKFLSKQHIKSTEAMAGQVKIEHQNCTEHAICPTNLNIVPIGYIISF